MSRARASERVAAHQGTGSNRMILAGVGRDRKDDPPATHQPPAMITRCCTVFDNAKAEIRAERREMMANQVTVTAKMAKDHILILEFYKSTGDLHNVSVAHESQRDAIPEETELCDFVVKLLGNVLARECPGCFATTQEVTLTFHPTTGKVVKYAYPPPGHGGARY